MGLESVELMMDVEDRFEIAIPDSAMEQIQTVGDLHAFLMDRIRQQNSGVCLSAALFYPVRKILVDDFSVDRAEVRPATRLESMVAKGDRQRFWSKLEEAVAARLPRLKRSKWFQWKGDMFPESCSTVGQLVNHCVDLNKITDEFRPDDSDRVWEIVCEMVADLAGVERSSLKQDTDFITDLGF